MKRLTALIMVILSVCFLFSGCNLLPNRITEKLDSIFGKGANDDNQVSHTHSYIAVLTSPTLVDNGYTTYICECGDSYVSDYTPALGYYSTGFEFELNEDRNGYILTDIGGCTDADIVIPAIYKGLPVTSIGDGAFYNCVDITSVTIPNSVTSIGFRSFLLCPNLTSVTIPDSVTNIGYAAFAQCGRLANITIPNNITSIEEETFASCDSLIGISIPDSVTSIGDHAFNNCDRLVNIIIPNSITDIGKGAFSMCRNLDIINIPESVTSIGDGAFANSNVVNIFVDENNKCYKSVDGNLYTKDGTKLVQYAIGKAETSFSIPDSVTNIGYLAFSCSNLVSITIGSSVTDIADSAFLFCSNLTSITIPNSVTSIGYRVFANCESIVSITIPESVIDIGEEAFYFCDSLSIINYYGTKSQWNNISKGYNWDYLTGNYTIVYDYN